VAEYARRHLVFEFLSNVVQGWEVPRIDGGGHDRLVRSSVPWSFEIRVRNPYSKSGLSTRLLLVYPCSRTCSSARYRSFIQSSRTSRLFTVIAIFLYGRSCHSLPRTAPDEMTTIATGVTPPASVHDAEKKVYVTGFKLALSVGSVTVVCFLLLLDQSILSTASLYTRKTSRGQS